MSSVTRICPPEILVLELSHMSPLDSDRGACWFCGHYNNRIHATSLTTRLKGHHETCLWRNAHEYLDTHPQFVARVKP
jgi:hypothetical protein